MDDDRRHTIAGEGPPALLLHAGGEDHTVWSPVIGALVAAGCSAAAPDLPGHGRRTGPPPDRLEVVSREIPEMIEAFPAAPVLVGASLGGLAALLALADRDVEAAVAGLVLVDVVPDPPPVATRAWLEQRFGPRVRTWSIVEDVLGRGRALRSVAAALRVPVLLVRGAASPLTDADAERLRRSVAGAEIARVPGAGHLVARDEPLALAAILSDWLRRPVVRRRRIERFLRAAGAEEIDHPGGTLLGHLHRTGDTLRRWGAASWVEDAGRVHAACGTEGFALPPPAVGRAGLRHVVGAPAEELVHRYGVCQRARSYRSFTTDRPFVLDRITGRRSPLDAVALRAFVELTVANELDVLAHAPRLAALHGDELARLFRAWRPLLSAPARADVDAWTAEHCGKPPIRRAAGGRSVQPIETPPTGTERTHRAGPS